MVRPRWQRLLYVIAGHVLVALGIIGLALPIVPTTPFLLAAAACYARGSPRFHDWLMNHRWFGPHIRAFRERRGFTRKAKALAITVSLLGMTGSLIFFRAHGLPRIVAVIVAATFIVSVLRQPTRED